MPLNPVRVLSVIPPMTQLNTPYPSTAYLTGFLRSRGVQAVQEDLALRLILELFSPAGLQELQRAASALPAPRRSASVQALAGWDHANRHIANDVLRLLADPDPEVRIAAIGASSIASLKSDPIKKRLLGLLNDPSQMLDVRSVALMNLDRFAFTPDEHADLMVGKRQLEDDAKKP